MKTAVITFFDAYPPKTGSGIVCTDFFNSWNSPRKKLFQFSQFQNKKKNIETIFLLRNKPIFKIINLPLMTFKIIQYLKSEKKKIIILEGASWIFYSFFLIFFLKIIYKNVFFIYRSHNIEYEIRKKNSNFFIAYFTKLLEKYVISKCDISTSVSRIEQKKFKKYYNQNTLLFPNSLDIGRLKKIKEKKINSLPSKYLFFSGSYDYLPNKKAIDFIINKILPNVKKQNIKLVLTGNHKKKFNHQDILNFGFVSMNQLKYLQRKSICLIVPLFEGFGTRIKILESLILGNRVISTSKGIEGINFEKNNNIIISNNLKNIVGGILKFSKLKKKVKYNSKNLIKFSMKENTKKLYKFSMEEMISSNR